MCKRHLSRYANYSDLSAQNYCNILQGEIHHVVNPNPYRGVFGSDANRYAKDLQDHIDFGTSGKVAGFIAETIQVIFFSFLFSSFFSFLASIVRSEIVGVTTTSLRTLKIF